MRVGLDGIATESGGTVVVPDLGTVGKHHRPERLPDKFLRALVLAEEDVRPLVEEEPVDLLRTAVAAEIVLLLEDFATSTEVVSGGEAAQPRPQDDDPATVPHGPLFLIVGRKNQRGSGLSGMRAPRSSRAWPIVARSPVSRSTRGSQPSNRRLSERSAQVSCNSPACAARPPICNSARLRESRQIRPATSRSECGTPLPTFRMRPSIAGTSAAA